MGPLERQIFSMRPLIAVIGALLAATVILSGALAWLALRPARVVVVPGVRDHQVVVPEQVPDAAVRKFATLYLAFFDGYTPETVEERSTYILRFIAPEFLKDAGKDLPHRATYAVRTKEPAQITLPPASSQEASEVARLPGGLLRFTTVGERRIYIASELKATQRLRYVLDLKPTLPSDEDPYGFQVVGQSIRPEPPVSPSAIKESSSDHP